MAFDKILSAVSRRRPNLESGEARAVATDIYYSGEPDGILASDAVIDKLITGYRARQASTGKSVAADDPKVCPVCKLPLRPVILADDRSAVFCAKHFVVFPVPPENKE